jgi:hydrogenase nickel incorporation protein HypA/HybF
MVMHELAVCQALMEQVEGVARDHQAVEVQVIHLGIGPLSGVEPRLLEQAFAIASAGSIASGARLTVHELPVRVRCRQCDKVTDAQPARLVCGECGDWQTQLVSGDELQLSHIELTRKANSGQHATAPEQPVSGETVS